MLVLRGSLSKARAILKDTLHGLKSLFSTGYQRLPKAPPLSAFSCGGNERQLHRSFRELDGFYDGFTQQQQQQQQQWDNINNSATTAIDEKNMKSIIRRRKNKKKMQRSEEENMGLVVGGGGGETSDEDAIYRGSFMGFARIRRAVPAEERHETQLEARSEEQEKNRINRRGAGKGEAGEVSDTDSDSFSQKLRVELCCTVAEGIKKLEQIDAANVEHVLDIEERIHFVSVSTQYFHSTHCDEPLCYFRLGKLSSSFGEDSSLPES
ncbi:hypothetical protein H6P81_000306 [Aristolochia fimbriata]|uniref:Uncharacterized protein n=1 Tax=Aristolochia fimbriata TaxID=158543 RepID=A0AAV7F401_ARIFI|nr:hypothetical protein H6P81_000306 [Aristolochia fimbriata]